MNFGDALTALRAGDMVRRAGWEARRWLVTNAAGNEIMVRTSKTMTKWDKPTDDMMATDWKVASTVEVDTREAEEDRQIAEAKRRAEEEAAARKEADAAAETAGKAKAKG